MIKSWQHKGLKLFYEKGSLKGIQAKHKLRLTIILQRLDAAIAPEDLNLPGMEFHKLKGNLKNFYSVSVSGNWRIIYKFEGKNAIFIDYVDYH
jgi:toxin HigB-1